MDLLREYWWIVAIVVVLLLALLLLRPKQRVTLTDSAPIRPHMQRASRPSETVGKTTPAAAAAVTAATPASGTDDLSRLKGVGPKFADTLRAAGFSRFEQIASLSPDEVERLDDQLGAFRGRIRRDRIVEQADYLARDDTDGFEQRFGKL